MTNDHDLQELRVFRQFLSALGISEGPDTLEKRKKEGEPDLLFRHPGGEVVAYELVRLVDPHYAREVGVGEAGKNGLVFSTKREICNHFDSLPPSERLEFERRYGDADVYLAFSPSTSINERRHMMSLVFQKLLALPYGVTGEVLTKDPSFRGILLSVWVSRGIVGPTFDVASFVRIGDLTVPNLKKKFRKQYVSSYPIELVAYIDRSPMFHDDVWLGNLRNFLEDQPRPFPFRHLWIFDCRRNQIRFQCAGS